MRFEAQSRSLTEPRAGGRAGSSVVVEPMLIGRIQLPPGVFENPGGRLEGARMRGIGSPRASWREVPVAAFLVRHPGAGPFLVDTGLHSSVVARPEANLGSRLARFARPQLEPSETLPAQLRERGIDIRDLRLVVLTHMHFDRVSALAELPNATFVMSEAEWSAATSESGSTRTEYHPATYNYAFDYRTVSYAGEGITSYSSFGRSFDLFGDGSVRLAATPGHTLGHQAVICRLADRDLVIAGDAIYSRSQLTGGALPPAADAHTYRRSLQELRLFARQYPQAEIIPGKDAADFERLAPRYE